MHKSILRGLAIALTIAGLIAINKCIFRGYPLSADETQYLAQAQLFAHGKLHSTGDIPPHWLASHTWIGPGKWMSKYPPGTSILLAIGILLGDVSISGALAGALSLLLMYRFVRPWTEGPVALASTVIVALHPVFWGYAASYFSQIYSLCFSLALLVFATEDRGRGRLWLEIFAAALMAGLVLIRPSDAGCAWLALLPFLLLRRDFRGALAITLGLTVGALTLCGYHSITVGSFRLALYGESFFTLLAYLAGDLRSSSVEYWTWYWRGLSLRTGQLLWTWFGRYGGWALLFGGMGGLFACHRIPRFHRAYLLSMAAVTLGFYSFIPFMGWPTHGIRYQIVVVVIFGILFAALLQWGTETARRHFPSLGRLAWIPLGALVAWQGFVASAKMKDLSVRFQVVDEQFAKISSDCPDRTVVRGLDSFEPLAPFFINADTFARLADPTGDVPAARSLKGRHLFIKTWKEQDESWLLRHPEWKLCVIQLPSLHELRGKLRASELQPFFVPFRGDARGVPL